MFVIKLDGVDGLILIRDGHLSLRDQVTQEVYDHRFINLIYFKVVVVIDKLFKATFVCDKGAFTIPQLFQLQNEDIWTSTIV